MRVLEEGLNKLFYTGMIYTTKSVMEDEIN